MSNSIEARTLGSIALGQIHNGTRTCRFLSLHTGKPFTANHFTVLPITDLVVEHLNNMAKKDKIPTREPIFRPHGENLYDESSIPETKIDLTPDPTTLGTPITITTDETDEEDFPVPILTSPTNSEESTERQLVRPIRGVEAQAEAAPYIRSNEDVDSDRIAGEHSHIDPEMPELIDDSDDEDDAYDPPTIKTPAETAPHRSTRNRKAPDRLNLLCVEDSHKEKTQLLSYHMTARRAMKEIRQTSDY